MSRPEKPPGGPPGGEFEFICQLRARTPPSPAVLVGPGDDCAVLAPRPRASVATTDTLTEGVDFLLTEAGAFAVGVKAMGANLSDIAAMAARPTAALVSVVLPRGPHTGQIALDLDRGLRAMADRFGVPIVGGDTNTWDGGLVVTVAVLGEVSERGAVLRSGARPGDWLFVTGPLGGSLLGRHLSPTPRIPEALALHEFAELHALIDISDGLAADLGHLLDESGCGVELDGDAVPVHPDAVARAALTGRPALEHALGDGEDFELILAVSPSDGARLVAAPPVPVWKVGECVAAGRWLIAGGRRVPLEGHGWAHAFG